MRPTLIALALAAALAAPAVADPAAWRQAWPETDFTRSQVDLSEIRSGGPPRDGIPAVDDPALIPVAEEARIAPAEPVIALEMPGEAARAYPVRYLMWHEIANDEVGGVPVAVTFCPLCNSGLVFDRRVEGRALTFGVSGLLRHSDMVMFDRETESWWQQATGRAIVGALSGAELTALPSWMESWAEFAARNPEGLVMDQPDAARDYGANPYVSYDSAERPFLYAGEMPPHGIDPLARVVRVEDRAWTLERLAEMGAVEEAGLRIEWRDSGQASALDARAIAEGRSVGTIRVFDAATGAPVFHDIPFAFAFHALWPEGTWMLGD